MPAATNLQGYYSGQGQALPSITARAQLYSSNGGTGNYMGSAQQNQYLLGKLQGGTSPTGTSVSFGAAPAPAAPQPTGYEGVTAAEQALSAGQAGLQDPTARYNSIAASQGIPAQQQTISDLMRQLNTQQGLANDLPANINTRLQGLGTNVTEAQRARWQANEAAPIANSIGKLSSAKAVEDNSLAMKNATVKDLMTAAQQGDTNAITRLSDAVTNAKDSYSAVQAQKAAAATTAAKSGGSGGSTPKTPATPTTAQATASLNQDIQKAVDSGANMDPTDQNEGGAKFFTDLFNTYSPYGFTMAQIQKLVTDSYSAKHPGG